MKNTEEFVDKMMNCGRARVTRKEILAAAKQCVCGDREQDYGSPEASFAMIAALWEPYIREKCVKVAEVDGTHCTTVDVAPSDIAAMMCLFKLARIITGHGKADNWIDLAGYAACGGELEGK